MNTLRKAKSKSRFRFWTLGLQCPHPAYTCVSVGFYSTIMYNHRRETVTRTREENALDLQLEAAQTSHEAEHQISTHTIGTADSAEARRREQLASRFELVQLEDGRFSMIDNDTLDSSSPVLTLNEVAKQLLDEALALLESMPVDEFDGDMSGNHAAGMAPLAVLQTWLADAISMEGP